MSVMMGNSSRTGYGECLYVKVADDICNYVEQKELKNGDKIPSERELSTMLSVSRNSVREAIRELESRGILKVHPGKGAFLVGNVEDRTILIQMKKMISLNFSRSKPCWNGMSSKS